MLAAIALGATTGWVAYQAFDGRDFRVAAPLVAALVAPGAAVRPRAGSAVWSSRASGDTGHASRLEQLRLEPRLDRGLRLGEGSGAALGITLCVAACRLLDEMATFDEAGVDGSDDAVAPES